MFILSQLFYIYSFEKPCFNMRSTNVYIRSTHFRNWSCSGVVNCHVFLWKCFMNK